MPAWPCHALLVLYDMTRDGAVQYVLVHPGGYGTTAEESPLQSIVGHSVCSTHTLDHYSTLSWQASGSTTQHSIIIWLIFNLYSTAQRSAASAAQHSTAQHSTAQHSTANSTQCRVPACHSCRMKCPPSSCRNHRHKRGRSANR
jgi:hypothetical protein